MNLLIIRNDIPDLQFIIDNTTQDTICLIHDKTKSIKYLLSKINTICVNNKIKRIKNIGFMTTNDYISHFYVSINDRYILDNCDLLDPELNSWHSFIEFLIHIKTTYMCDTLDLLTCNIYNNSTWQYIIDKLNILTDVQVRSSDNITGLNGDWILESHNVNLCQLYFTENIKNYLYNLDFPYNINFITTTDNKIYSTGNDINGKFHNHYNNFKECQQIDNLSIKEIANGYNYTIILTNNNKIYGCGINDSGQLGDGTITNKYFLTEMDLTILKEESISHIYSSGNSSYILTSTSKIYSCGANFEGQLGHGNKIDRTSLTPINTTSISSSMSSIKKIATGQDFFIVLTNDNKLFSCGNNTFGQLGINNNTSTTILTPMFINVLSNSLPIDVACGDNFTIVLTHDNKIFGCGYNNFGQLGTGNNTNQDLLVQMNLSNLFGSVPRQISCGSFFTAILTNNELFFCGLNLHGQFGNGTKINNNIPTKTSLNRTIIPSKISCGLNHSIILTSDNKIYTSGANYYGQLGINSTIDVNNFTLVNTNSLNISSNTKIFAKNDTNFILSDTLYACGLNIRSELLNNDYISFSDTKLYNSPTKIKMLKYCRNFIVILTENNKLYTCGINTYGQLGIGSIIDTNILNELEELTIELAFPIFPIDISCGDEHFVILTNNYNVYGCGRNNYRQLGFTQTQNVTKLTRIPIGNSNIKQIACGAHHTFFLTRENELFSCGLNNYGQLGNETISNSNGITKINTSFLNDNSIIFVDCGSYHTTILTNTNEIYSCGLNNRGQLGNGTNNNTNTFIKMDTNILQNSTVISISCGAYHTAILNNQNTLFSCGLNNVGQLGNDTTTNSNTLIITNTENNKTNKLISVYANKDNTFILDDSHILYACGDNTNGESGTGRNTAQNYKNDLTFINTPNDMIDSSISIVAGSYNTYILGKNNTDIYGSGKNSHSQLNSDDSILDSDSFIQFDTLSVLNNKSISFIEAGNQNIFIISDNKLYGCGKNSLGQLGNNFISDVTSLTRITLDPPSTIPKKVYTFNEHTFLLNTNNTLYSTGRNTYGQLGLGTNTNVTKFTIVNLTFLQSANIIDIACGNNHTMILTDRNKLYTCGSNYYGQLGNGTNTDTNTFIEINPSVNGNPISIACGANHSIVLTDTYKIYGCGINNYGQLGNGTINNSNIFIPIIIDNIIPRSIHCGYDWTLVISDDNKFYSCGRNTEGQIYTNSDTYISKLQEITTDFETIDFPINISCGFYHFTILTNTKKIYTFGNNDYGQTVTTKQNINTRMNICKRSTKFNIFSKVIFTVSQEENDNYLSTSEIIDLTIHIPNPFYLNANFIQSKTNKIKGLLYNISSIQDIIDNYDVTLTEINEVTNINELISMGYTLDKLKGVDIQSLIDYGFTIDELLLDDVYTLEDLKGVKINLKGTVDLNDLIEANYTVSELRDANFTATELKENGVELEELVDGNFNALELKTAGFVPEELVPILDAEELLRAFDIEDIAEVEGIDQIDFLPDFKSVGYTPDELLDVGYDKTDITDIGFTAYELRINNFTIEELLAADYDINTISDVYPEWTSI